MCTLCGLPAAEWKMENGGTGGQHFEGESSAFVAGRGRGGGGTATLSLIVALHINAPQLHMVQAAVSVSLC